MFDFVSEKLSQFASFTLGRMSTMGGPCHRSRGNCWRACIIMVAARM
jgi:hypothetical protein